MRFFILIILITFNVSCSSNKNDVAFSFFAAGHTYGRTTKTQFREGLYKPFYEKIDFINKQDEMVFGILLGDVVRDTSGWQNAITDISKFNFPIHIARGNHDGPLAGFEEKFGKSYSSFIKQDNLFIILDGNINRWNIVSDQLDFLKKTISENHKKVKNIFIFSHQLIWLSKDKTTALPNSFQGKAKNLRFWKDIEPILTQLNQDVYLFAGDVGAFSRKKDKKVTNYSFEVHKNLKFITTGMGGGKEDNFIIVTIFNDGSVKFRLIHLNGDNLDSLGNLN